jgi:hypothetical protein
MQAMHPHLEFVDLIIRIAGWPALIGALVWVIRTYDRSARQMKDIIEATTDIRRMASETHESLAVISTKLDR